MYKQNMMLLMESLLRVISKGKSTFPQVFPNSFSFLKQLDVYSYETEMNMKFLSY